MAEVSLAANAAKGARGPRGRRALGARGRPGRRRRNPVGAWEPPPAAAARRDSLKAAATGAAHSVACSVALLRRAPHRRERRSRSSLSDDLTAGEAAYYAHLKTLPVNPATVNNAVAGAVNTLKPSEFSGLSGSFKEQLADVMKGVNSGLPLTANDMNSMARQLSAAQRGGTDDIAGTKIGNVLQSFYSGAQADARDGIGAGQGSDSGWNRPKSDA